MSNQLLSEVIEYLPDAIFAIDLNGKVIAWNNAIGAMTDTVKDDILGEGSYVYSKLFYEEHRPCIIELIGDENSELTSNYDFIHRKGNKVYAEVFVPLFYNGKGAYLEITASPLLDGKGLRYGAIEYIRDITERKKEEIQLKKSEQHFRNVVESAADVIITTDAEGNILSYNDSMENIFGYSKEEIIGAKLTVLMQDKHKNLFTNEIENIKSHAKHPNVNKTIKKTGIRKDGTKFPFEGSLSTWKSAENNYFTIIIRDITNVEQVTEALSASEEKYRAFFESDPDYAILIDSKGVIADVNHAAMQISGLSKEELVGKSFRDLNIFHEDELALHQKKFSKVLRREKIVPYEARIINKKGSVIWVLNSSTTITKDDKINYVLVIGSDISELKNAEIKLKSSINEKEVLLKETHHRVKNNLQIISSLLNLQELYVKEDPTAVNVLKESKNRVLSMAMIHEMLYQSTNLSHINIPNYIENLISNLVYSYGYKSNIKTVLNVEEIMLNIETSIPVGLIIGELVSNSLRHAFPHNQEGKITLSLKVCNNGYNLVISDDGVDLPPKFDFRNVESTLGLKLVNSLVEQLDGSIELDKNHGTQFTIKFKEQRLNKRI